MSIPPENSLLSSPLNLRQRFALFAWVLYWTSYLIPVVSNGSSFYPGWKSAEQSYTLVCIIFDSSRWKNWGARDFLTSALCLLNNVLILSAYFFVRRPPAAYQKWLYGVTALANLSLPFLLPLNVEIGFICWVAAFGAMAYALRLPNAGRPIQFGLGVLVVGVFLGGACAIPVVPIWFVEAKEEIQALIICIPAAVLAADLYLEVRARWLQYQLKRQNP